MNGAKFNKTLVQLDVMDIVQRNLSIPKGNIIMDIRDSLMPNRELDSISQSRTYPSHPANSSSWRELQGINLSGRFPRIGNPVSRDRYARVNYIFH